MSDWKLFYRNEKGPDAQSAHPMPRCRLGFRSFQGSTGRFSVVQPSLSLLHRDVAASPATVNV